MDLDEVGTLLANVRLSRTLLQVGAPPALVLTPIEELEDLKTKTLAEITFQTCLKHKTACNYLFNKFLRIEKGQANFLVFMSDVRVYCARYEDQRVKEGPILFEKHFTPQESAEPQETPSSPATARAVGFVPGAVPGAVPASDGLPGAVSTSDGGGRGTPKKGSPKSPAKKSGGSPSGLPGAVPASGVVPEAVPGALFSSGGSSVGLPGAVRSSGGSSGVTFADGTETEAETVAKTQTTRPAANDDVLGFMKKNHPGVVEEVQKLTASGARDLFEPIMSRVLTYLEDSAFVDFKASIYFDEHVQMLEYTKKEVELKDFHVFRVLGRGAFGAVSAVQKKDTQAVFAMKEMAKKHVKQQHSESICLNERAVLSHMNSPFVLNLAYSFHNEHSLYFIFKMLGGGELNYHLHNEPERRFAAPRAQFYAAEMLLGLEHIHSFTIVYRDLKLPNVLLNNEGHVVISDLGLAVQLREGKPLREASGTPGYWGPEVLSQTGTLKTSDWWSWAVVLYLMLKGKKPHCACRKKTKEWCPFGHSKAMEENALEKDGILKLEIEYPPSVFSAEATDLLQRLFVPDPEKRLGFHSVDEIKQHPYFENVNWAQMERMEVPVPFVPSKGMVYANSIAEVGEVDTSKFRKIKLTEEDEKVYTDFYHCSNSAKQAELVECMMKIDTLPPVVVRPPPDYACCVIL